MHITHKVVHNFLHRGKEWLMERRRRIFYQALYKQYRKKRLQISLWVFLQLLALAKNGTRFKNSCEAAFVSNVVCEFVLSGNLLCHLSPPAPHMYVFMEVINWHRIHC